MLRMRGHRIQVWKSKARHDRATRGIGRSRLHNKICRNQDRRIKAAIQTGGEGVCAWSIHTGRLPIPVHFVLGIADDGRVLEVVVAHHACVYIVEQCGVTCIHADYSTGLHAYVVGLGSHRLGDSMGPHVPPHKHVDDDDDQVVTAKLVYNVPGHEATRA